MLATFDSSILLQYQTETPFLQEIKQYFISNQILFQDYKEQNALSFLSVPLLCYCCIEKEHSFRYPFNGYQSSLDIYQSEKYQSLLKSIDIIKAIFDSFESH